jgi:hypothetical protein
VKLADFSGTNKKKYLRTKIEELESNNKIWWQTPTLLWLGEGTISPSY